MEVRYERAARFDGDDRAVVLPYLLEQRGEQAVALGGGGLGLPERGEVRQQPLGLRELGVGGWCEALDLVLEGLAAHYVLRLGDVAEDVEVL